MALDFDGTNDYIEATSAALTAGPLTLAAWINVDTTGAAQRVLSISSATGNDRWSLQVGATNVITMQVGTSTPSPTFAALSTTNTVTAGTWHHVAGSWNTTTGQPQQVWIDGVKSGPTNSSRTPVAAELSRTLVGSTYISSALSQYMNGKVAEAAIWNAILSDTDVVSLSKGIKPTSIKPQNIVMYLPLVRDIVDTVESLSFTNSGSVVSEHSRRYG